MARSMVPVLLLILLTVPAAFASNNTYANTPDLIDDTTIVDMFAEVLHRQPGMDMESAAFIVRNKDGELQCMLWPNTGEYHQARYAFEPPIGVVAIVHTHPVQLREVSPGDRNTAMRIGIPIYAITPFSISEADVYGRATMLVRSELWSRNRPPRGLCGSR